MKSAQLFSGSRTRIAESAVVNRRAPSSQPVCVALSASCKLVLPGISILGLKVPGNDGPSFKDGRLIARQREPVRDERRAR